MSVASEINRIKTNISNAYTELKNKNATIPSVENSDNLASSIASITTGGGTIEKGIIINKCDSNGYATDVSVIGITSLPYFSFGSYNTTDNNFLTKNLTNVNLPESLITISDNAFYNCANLVITNLPESITSIGTSAFYGCTNLALTSLPSGITSIKVNTFYNCTKLALTSLPEGLTSIGSFAFQGCSNLINLKLPESLTTIDYYAFNSCKKLKSMTIPQGVTVISGALFTNCTSLTETTCLGDITTMGSGDFQNCTNFEKFVLPNVSSVPKLIGTTEFSGTKIAKGTGYIYVPDTLVDSFKTASGWSNYASQIKGISELPTE